MSKRFLVVFLSLGMVFTHVTAFSSGDEVQKEVQDKLSPWSRISQMCSIEKVDGRLEVRLKDNSEAIRLGVGVLKHIVANSLRKDLDLSAGDVKSLIDTHCGKFISSGAFRDLYWQSLSKRGGSFYMPAVNGKGEEVMLKFSRVADDELRMEENTVPIKDGFVLVEVMDRLDPEKVVVGSESMDLEEGAFTGAMNTANLKEVGISAVLVGHSETRSNRRGMEDTDPIVNSKIKAAVGNLEVTLCCGEPLYVRKDGRHKEFVISQLRADLRGISAEDFKSTVRAIAYEPIWAIGTGEKASPEQAQEMCYSIRELIREMYGSEIADDITIQYGGSIKPDNALSILSQPDVDGALIGGAALIAETFVDVAEIAENIRGKARPILISANWKASVKEKRDTPEEFFMQISGLNPTGIDIRIFTPAVMTVDVDNLFRKGIFYANPPKVREGIIVGVGNYGLEEGANTGIINADHIAEAGIGYALVGHSETRDSVGLKGDSAVRINRKIRAADGKFKVILCCGEPVAVRDNGKHEEYIVSQLEKDLYGITKEQFDRTVVAIAYEPIWAIGTGKKASSEQAQEMCRVIREFVRSKYGDSTADVLRIQYGGSVTPENAGEILSQPDIDGALIGGAALRAESFARIVSIAEGIKGKPRALLVAGNWKANVPGPGKGERDGAEEFMWRLEAENVNNTDVALFVNSAIATSVKSVLSGNMSDDYLFEGHLWECMFKSGLKMKELEETLAEVKETKPNSLILYADEMIDKGAVLDLADTIKSAKVKESGILKNASVILFAEKRGKTEPEVLAVKRMIELADDTIEVTIADRTDLNGNISDEAGEIKALKNLASQKLSRSTGLSPEKDQFLGVFKGPNEDMHVIPEISSSLELPVVIFGKMNGIYSFAEALEKALSIRYSKTPSRWFAYLDPVKLLSVEKLRQDFEMYVSEILIKA